MAVTVADLKVAFAPTIPADVLTNLDPAKPMLEQGVDSLALTAMAVALQNVYGIQVTVEEGLTLKTFDDLAAFVNRRTA